MLGKDIYPDDYIRSLLIEKIDLMPAARIHECSSLCDNETGKHHSQERPPRVFLL